MFQCNTSNYEKWYWDDDLEYTALRNQGSGLCLTARNGQSVMKPCLATDQAATWMIDESNPRRIINAVTHTCLARMENGLVHLTTCTGGESQRWWLS
ncbi:RICIN domain-containing protein [Streptomyces sp. HUAS TT3]|uniref:RICIN domain-containing protein n=1 Tax=Streptomyces sp. HUAS TT3 TaxID=3447510 RepID=UPI003F658484